MIRPMRHEDKAAVLDLIRDTGMFTAAEVSVAEELIDTYPDVPGQKDYRVAVVDGEGEAIAGYMTWGPTPLTENAYDLYWMAVARKEQGKGWGKAMVRWLEEEIREAGGRMILIETSSTPRYEPTRQFYLHLDYKEVARVPDFYRAGDDRVIYAKSFR
jgi:GNAT superfamily N-acetyltransferase